MDYLPDLLPDDPKSLAALVVVSFIIIWRLGVAIKNELIRQMKLFSKKTDAVEGEVDELKTTVAVHEEKHKQSFRRHDRSEKRIDHIEDGRTKSKR